MSKVKKKDSIELEEQSYEKLLEQLTVVVEELETGEVSLEQSLLAYEKGIALVRHAQARIENMEQRLEELTAKGDLKPFELKNEHVLNS